MLPLIILSAAAFVAAIAIATVVIGTYNRLVSSRQIAGNGFSQIEVQLKRRYDLIPGLVETVGSYLSHERETLQSVIEARGAAQSGLSNVSANLNDPAVVGSWAASESALGGAIGRLAMVMEAYPELKANETIASLMEELTSTENRIAFARQAYNDTATTFNIRRQSFPTVAFAGVIGFGDDLTLLNFEHQPEIHQAPKIDLTPATVG
ncbi:LemA family protein [Rubripirellula lacrimiformis]|uniref:LemA family protein n=1 Tax=Rubripirellula lacrimiformis TaxID=1930273 RepID=A0A517N3I9_9BACT|nr:LemA family protein [Rubripirellula lacrimiformis]QDT01694.1 LemA family protein [Rubripirellula lacrimiformis]